MGERYEIFEIWIDDHRGQIDSGAEVTVPIKDLETLAKMTVLAKLSQSESPKSSRIRVVNDMGEKRGELYIQVVRELEEEDQ